MTVMLQPGKIRRKGQGPVEAIALVFLPRVPPLVIIALGGVVMLAPCDVTRQGLPRNDRAPSSMIGRTVVSYEAIRLSEPSWCSQAAVCEIH